MSAKSRLALSLAATTLIAACGGSNAGSFQSSLSDTASPVRQAGLLQQAAVTQQSFTAYITGYSYWDNTPVGTTEIALPVIHSGAGGQGTYIDPITLAVGHSIIGGRSKPDVPAGTRFYLENLKRYAIVEDVCGDGPTPQNGPCHTGHDGYPWFDIYVGGAQANAQVADACARKITALQTVIMNPAPNLPVSRGELTESGC